MRAAKAIVLIRILVGWVFLSEGIQKFLFPDTLGVGRFVKIGIPWPHAMAPFVGTVEILCGTLVLVGLFTRFAAIPLLGVIYGRFVFDKVCHVFEIGFLGHASRRADRCEHAARADLSGARGWRFMVTRCSAAFAPGFDVSRSNPSNTSPGNSVSVGTIFLSYLRLGCTSFGGPIAHLGYFREEFVVRRDWLDDATFTEGFIHLLVLPSFQFVKHNSRATQMGPYQDRKP